jgi:hypothetical protein
VDQCELSEFVAAGELWEEPRPDAVFIGVGVDG